MCKFEKLLKKPFWLRLMRAFLTLGVRQNSLAGAALSSLIAVLDCSHAGFSASSILNCENRGLCSFCRAIPPWTTLDLAGLTLACELLGDKFVDGNRLFRLSEVPVLVLRTRS